jgi:hypothetical protein
MQTLVLLDRFYSYGKDIDETYLSRALIQLIKEKIKNYDVEIQYIKMENPENRPVIVISGKDEKFIYNYLIKEYGTISTFSDLKIGQILRGRMRNPEDVNFGVFLDCGIENPKKDALLPVYNLRKQLVDDKKIPKKKICEAYGFFEEMPVNIKITKIDPKEKTIECELAEQSVNLFHKWVDDGFEILFSIGVPRKQVKHAIKRTGHYEDYITIDRLGFLETATFLKIGSHAPGILSHIGPKLKNVKFSMLRPSNVKHLIQLNE